MTGKKHIAILMGGWSAEREVSLSSGKAVTTALLSLGHEVTPIDMKPDEPVTAVVEALTRARPDVVFNALHGRFGEDGTVQGLLDLMKIPYTHSGVLASALAMDKPMAKRVFEAAGLRCPRGCEVSREELMRGDPLPRPFVIKPANEGSSVGVHIVTENENRTLAMIMDDGAWRVEGAPKYQEPRYLVEEYIAGREITVAVLNNKPLGVTEIKPKTGFYDYEHKYTDGVTDHLCPAPLPKNLYDDVMQLALTAHLALGCRGLSRADFRYDDKHFYLLEVNTQPGMTALSLSPEIAAHAGISFDKLVQELVEDARYG